MITLGYYCIDYFWVLSHRLLLGTTTDLVFCQQAYSSKILYNFYFKLCKFLCNFILISCIYYYATCAKNPGPRSKTINEAIRLFSGLADLDFEPGYNDLTYF